VGRPGPLWAADQRPGQSLACAISRRLVAAAFHAPGLRLITSIKGAQAP
jgi:hypothetical protein